MTRNEQLVIKLSLAFVVLPILPLVFVLLQIVLYQNYPPHGALVASVIIALCGVIVALVFLALTWRLTK